MVPALMIALETACVLILAVYVRACVRDKRTLTDAAVIAAGAWIGEDTCIRAYDFYQYTDGWHLWLDRVPVMIVAIWPAVVLSARAITRALVGAGRVPAWKLGVLTGAVVCFDAALIEPLAVNARLWTWNAPGLFGVPPVGVLGWGFFGGAVTWAQESRARANAFVLAPAFTHLALLGSWWGALRWFHGGLSALAGTVFVAAISLVATVAIVRGSVRLATYELLARAVATLFFAGLLALHWNAALGSYAAAFALPHLALSLGSLAGSRPWRTRDAL